MIAYFKEQQVEALGIGFFGPVILNEQSPKYGCVGNTPKLAWKWYPVLDEFKKALQIPVGFDTDVNAAALGEATWGITKGLKNSIYITVGTGIGAGVIVDGKMLHGMQHPEGGHILVAPHPNDTYKGKCPYHGRCLEGMASGQRCICAHTIILSIRHDHASVTRTYCTRRRRYASDSCDGFDPQGNTSHGQ